MAFGNLEDAMDHSTHRFHTTPRGDQAAHAHPSLNSVAFWATVHCLSGCAIGEALGMAIGVAAGLSTAQTIVLAVALAFVFGYAFTLVPLLRSGMTLRVALGVAFAADTASITLMEIVDNALMLLIPGAMDAGLSQPLFWGALTASLLIAGAAAYPLNRWLISRGKGHALVHARHGSHSTAEVAGSSVER